MSFIQRLRSWTDWFKRPPVNIPGPVEMPDIPQGCEIVSDKTEYVQTPGQTHTLFKRQRIIYSDQNGGMHEIYIKDNVYAPGCGHLLIKSTDIGFVSAASGLPVCKECETEYKRLRNQTRYEECVCRHLVAPHELKQIEGYGYLCPVCLKKHERFKPLKPIALILGFFLKPLIEENKEVSYEEITLPPPSGHIPPVQNHPPSWTEHPSASPPPYEMGGARSRQSDFTLPPPR